MAMPMMARMVEDLTNELKVSVKSIPSCCSKPMATSLALNLNEESKFDLPKVQKIPYLAFSQWGDLLACGKCLGFGRGEGGSEDNMVEYMAIIGCLMEY